MKKIGFNQGEAWRSSGRQRGFVPIRRQRCARCRDYVMPAASAEPRNGLLCGAYQVSLPLDPPRRFQPVRGGEEVRLIGNADLRAHAVAHRYTDVNSCTGVLPEQLDREDDGAIVNAVLQILDHEAMRRPLASSDHDQRKMFSEPVQSTIAVRFPHRQASASNHASPCQIGILSLPSSAGLVDTLSGRGD